MPEFVQNKIFIGVASFIGGVLVGKWIYEPSAEPVVAQSEGGKKKKKKHASDGN